MGGGSNEDLTWLKYFEELPMIMNSGIPQLRLWVLAAGMQRAECAVGRIWGVPSGGAQRAEGEEVQFQRK